MNLTQIALLLDSLVYGGKSRYFLAFNVFVVASIIANASCTHHNQYRDIEHLCKMVLVGLHNYHDTYRSLPPTESRLEYGCREYLVSWRHLIHVFVGQPSYHSHSGYPEIPETYASLEEMGLYVYGVCGRGTVLSGGTLHNIPPDAVMFLCAEKCDCRWDCPCEVVVGDNDTGIYINPNRKVDKKIESGKVAVGFSDGVVWVLSEDTP